MSPANRRTKSREEEPLHALRHASEERMGGEGPEASSIAPVLTDENGDDD
jgi:hypothetical protein